MPFWTHALMLVAGLALSVLSYVLMPKPQSRGAEPPKQKNPTADVGTPIPLVFGTVTVENPNVLWYGDKYVLKVKESDAWHQLPYMDPEAHRAIRDTLKKILF